MNRIQILVLALSAVIGAGCGQPAPVSTIPTGKTTVAEPEPPPSAIPDVLAPDVKDAPPALADVFKERNKLHKRQTGALLTISARWEQDTGREPVVRVYWSIDYNGPRRPFTILTPGKGTDPVVAHAWYLKPDGTVSPFTWGLGGGWIAGKQPRKQRDWFLVTDGGEPVAGRLQTGQHVLAGAMRRPPQPGDPPLWVQMEYKVTDRGDGFDWPVDPATGFATKGPAWTLDAWTGHLWSPVVPVAVK